MASTARRTGPEAWEARLREHALRYPETTEDFPWGHRALKVRGKVFVFLALEGGELSMSVKLPQSVHVALMQPFAEPTGYGLGRSGWVTARFAGRRRPPLEILCAWIDESYRAVAPKKLVAGLDAASGGARDDTPRVAARRPARRS